MPDQTSLGDPGSQYQNPYGSLPPMPPTPPTAQNVTVKLNGPENGSEPAPMSQPAPAETKVKTNWLMVVIFFVLGIIAGGAAGYFVATSMTGTEITSLQQNNAQLSARITQLEQQIANSGSTGGTNGGTTTPGTGVAPTVGGIKPDPATADWTVYTNSDFHFSFRHPTDYTVQEFQNSGDLEAQDLDPDEVSFAAGIFRAGEADPAGMVIVYKSPENDGPASRTIRLFGFTGSLPTTVTEQAAGAGSVSKVDEAPVVVNGTNGTEYTAVEGRGSEAVPGGSTYTGYFFEEQFDSSYLVTYCDSDQTSQANIVGCLWLTTFTILR